MKVVPLYLFIVFGISIPLALFERWGIAKFGVGWGEPLPANTFWGAPALQHVPFNIVDLRLFTRYHLVMFLIKVPIVSMIALAVLQHWTTIPFTGWMAWGAFVLACVLGVMVLEDFLFFVFNSLFQSPYPNALTRLLNGEANWHRYWNVLGIKLPNFYFGLPVVIAILLVIVQRIGR